jgi:hypothetical protein
MSNTIKVKETVKVNIDKKIWGLNMNSFKMKDIIDINNLPEKIKATELDHPKYSHDINKHYPKCLGIFLEFIYYGENRSYTSDIENVTCKMIIDGSSLNNAYIPIIIYIIEIMKEFDNLLKITFEYDGNMLFDLSDRESYLWGYVSVYIDFDCINIFENIVVEFDYMMNRLNIYNIFNRLFRVSENKFSQLLKYVEYKKSLPERFLTQQQYIEVENILETIYYFRKIEFMRFVNINQCTIKIQSNSKSVNIEETRHIECVYEIDLSKYYDVIRFLSNLENVIKQCKEDIGFNNYLVNESLKSSFKSAFKTK